MSPDEEGIETLSRLDPLRYDLCGSKMSPDEEGIETQKTQGPPELLQP